MNERIKENWEKATGSAKVEAAHGIKETEK